MRQSYTQINAFNSDEGRVGFHTVSNLSPTKMPFLLILQWWYCTHRIPRSLSSLVHPFHHTSFSPFPLDAIQLHPLLMHPHLMINLAYFSPLLSACKSPPFPFPMHVYLLLYPGVDYDLAGGVVGQHEIKSSPSSLPKIWCVCVIENEWARTCSASHHLHHPRRHITYTKSSGQ